MSETFENLTSNYPWLAWLIPLLAALLLSSALKAVLVLISKRLRPKAAKTKNLWDEVGLDLIDGLRHWVIFIWILFWLSRSFDLYIQTALSYLVVFVSVYQVALWGIHIIRNWNKNVLRKKIASDPSSASALGLLYTLAQAAFLILLTLIALSNLGVNISALLTGLGIGGIAVALAAQNILGDLFSSLSIVLDKPFVVGDALAIGDKNGTVENIGLKTTRIRSLSGEELIVSNKDLTESRVHNFKRMNRRRVVQSFGVVYTTSPEQLKQIPVWVKEFITKHEKLDFDRCHLAKFGDSSLDFEFVFYVNSPDYNMYMDLQQIVLLDIIRKFKAEKIEFAFPSRSLYVESFYETSLLKT